MIHLSRLLKEQPEFDRMMMHPAIPKQEKVQAMEAVFRGRVSDELTGLMEVVIQKERYGELQNIFTYFIEKVKEEKGIGVAKDPDEAIVIAGPGQIGFGLLVMTVVLSVFVGCGICAVYLFRYHGPFSQ